MPGSLHETELQLAAIQVETIRQDYGGKCLLGKLRHRLNREFFGQDLSQKRRFITALCSRAGARLRALVRSRGTRQAPVRQADEGLQIVAYCTGGMGDLIVARGFLESLSQAGGGVRLDVLLPPARLGTAQFVFRDSPLVRQLMGEADLAPATTPYDVIVRVGNLLSYEIVRPDRVARAAPGLLETLQAGLETQAPYATFIRRQPHLDGLFATTSFRAGLARLDVLGWLGHLPFGQDKPLVLNPRIEARQRFEGPAGLLGQRYITLHNGWDNVDHLHTASVTKAWPPEHYAEFVRLFKQRFPEVQVVQLGTSTSQPIPQVDHCLLNQTSLDETAWLLKHSLLHLDGDSGLVHMARALHTTCLVLFGPTPPEFFGYRQNLQAASQNCRNCWWTTNDWMHFCPRGLKTPECMTSIQPGAVVDQAAQHLASLLQWQYQACPLEQPAIDTASGVSVPLLEAGARLTLWPGTPGATSGPVPGPGLAASIYNLPCETAAAASVALSLCGEPLAALEHALREVLRLVQNGGELLLTWPPTDTTGTPHGRASQTAAVSAALEALGLAPLPAGTSHSVLLRKQHTGPLLAGT